MSTDIPLIKHLLPEDDGYIPVIVKWMHSWWGEKEGYTEEAISEYYRHSLNNDRYPHTYGLFLSNELIGTFQITMSDLFVRPDLYPWLANVYIAEEFRGRGFGTFLLGNISSIIREDPFIAEVYLYTTHEGLYERFGWELYEKTDTHLPERIQNIYRLKVR